MPDRRLHSCKDSLQWSSHTTKISRSPLGRWRLASFSILQIPTVQVKRWVASNEDIFVTWRLMTRWENTRKPPILGQYQNTGYLETSSFEHKETFSFASSQVLPEFSRGEGRCWQWLCGSTFGYLLLIFSMLVIYCMCPFCGSDYLLLNCCFSWLTWVFWCLFHMWLLDFANMLLCA